MSVILFRLGGVPEDEAQEVRALLEQHGIEYFETPGGRWGISLAAIWLRDESQLSQAKALIDDYQQARQRRAHQEYEQRKMEGSNETLLHKMVRQPIAFLFYVAIAILILYLSVKPFLDFAG